MATRAGRHPAQRAKAKAAGRKAENSPPIRVLARTGFFARGLMHIALWVLVIGFFDMAVRRLSQVLFDRPAGGPA